MPFQRHMAGPNGNLEGFYLKGIQLGEQWVYRNPTAPARLSDEKIKKNGNRVAPSFELTENPDILAAVAKLPDRPFCVGFAAESHDLLKHAREKLARKNVPLVVGNLGPATFGRDDNALVLVDADGHRELPQADKLTLARQLVAEIAARLASLSA